MAIKSAGERVFFVRVRIPPTNTNNNMFGGSFNGHAVFRMLPYTLKIKLYKEMTTQILIMCGRSSNSIYTDIVNSWILVFVGMYTGSKCKDLRYSYKYCATSGRTCILQNMYQYLFYRFFVCVKRCRLCAYTHTQYTTQAALLLCGILLRYEKNLIKGALSRVFFLLYS